MYSPTAPRRSARLAALAAAKASATVPPSRSPFASAPDAAIAQEIKTRIYAVMNTTDLSTRCERATRLMNFIRTEALSYIKTHDRFRAVVLDKCREFYFMELVPAELKAECVALMLALMVNLDSPLPVAPLQSRTRRM